ncbi:Pam3-gp28 family putative phage holin [Gellertiella hungarica]|uniref:Uncharacterized protein n=1 Tax=Gellertiella hungarica TaxID=1572859 RepID=A0A7W6J3H8_9HYPH|nr:hypothetical protein [Gellertiella hungarica]MBB4064063.1 hypothetical protein [Gellertiella hungarica]
MNALYGPLVTILAIIIRHSLTAVGTGILFENMTDTAVADFTTQLAGVVVTVAGIAWSIYEKRKSGQLSTKKGSE